MTMQHIQAANNLITYFLKEYGYNGREFEAEINILTKKKKTTVSENHGIFEVLVAGTIHAAIFHVTGGGHFTSEKMFLVAKITSKMPR